MHAQYIRTSVALSAVFYLAVTRKGDVAAADEIIQLAGDPGFISVSRIFRLYLAKEL